MNNADRWRWVVWWCVAIPAWGWAAQDNLLDIERHNPTFGSASDTTEPRVQQDRQRSLDNARNEAGRARIVQSEQQNLLAAPEPSSPPSVGNPPAHGALHATDSGDTPVTPVTPVTQQAPDERPLWQLLKANRLGEYDQRIDGLVREFPSWRPSQALIVERARRQRDAEIAAALNGEPGALRKLIARAPDEFGCAHIDRLWKAADLFVRTGYLDDVYALYRTVIPACKPDANRIATLYRAQRELPVEQTAALIDLEASQGRRDADGEAAFERLRYQRAVAALGTTPAADASAARQLAALAPSIRAYRDAPAATLAGWIELAQHHVEEADSWFDAALTFAPGDVDATLGLVQAQIEQRAFDSAMALLAQPSLRDEPRARRARAQIAVAQANAAYGQRRYRDSLQLLDVAASEGMPAADTEALRGWNLYALGQYVQAVAVFRERYERDHDDDSAEGLALATLALNHGAAPERLAAAAGGGLVGSYLDALGAQQLYYRKQFVASRVALRDARVGGADGQRIGRYVPADLNGIDAASVAGGLTWSDHVGAAGQGRLDTIAPALRGEWIHNTTQYELRYRQLFLNAGTTSLDQTVPGSLGRLESLILDGVGNAKESVKRSLENTFNNFRQVATVGGSARAEELQVMVADSIRIGALPRFDWSVSAGATQGAPAGFQPTREASIGQQTSWGMWTTYIGVMPVRDSLLSWRGMTLPAAVGGGKWGAVRRMAGGTQVRWQVAPRWNVNAAVEGQWLTGMNVVGNEGMSADLSGGYDFRVPGFDYFSMGPALHYLSYRRNENFYSWGQGGYYSPQSSLGTGVALQWLSKEGRNWQWQGNLETGWNDTLQRSERCFPLGLTAGLANAIAQLPGSSQSIVDSAAQFTCAGSHDHGPYAHAQLAAVTRLGSRLQLGALVDANVTPGRDRQFAALAFVRYFLAPRAAVFSRDLPHNARDFYLQLDDNHN
ncbi:cellulose synthase subunit BcsC-related outer membrane protein [Paraburkholderia lacunae]|uniref:Cellulose synthase operon C C-terminal domain-containing protein n=1 Tax=Paraburkholderia lacunae TaxID=2211104 RepID=A0A370N350_9BURK|nr:cellulose synthase subunit BcsC-related outer membrane protein [Paraburkholderia lacunae]RDK00026.1 hypothetical protein DLM46_25295 [Paraburkholderia lacunae]